MGTISIKTEDIEPGGNLRRGMINEVEKPSCEKAMSLFMWKVQKKDKGVEAIIMKSKINFRSGR